MRAEQAASSAPGPSDASDPGRSERRRHQSGRALPATRSSRRLRRRPRTPGICCSCSRDSDTFAVPWCGALDRRRASRRACRWSSCLRRATRGTGSRCGGGALPAGRSSAAGSAIRDVLARRHRRARGARGASPRRSRGMRSATGTPCGRHAVAASLARAVACRCGARAGSRTRTASVRSASRKRGVGYRTGAGRLRARRALRTCGPRAPLPAAPRASRRAGAAT